MTNVCAGGACGHSHSAAVAGDRGLRGAMAITLIFVAAEALFGLRAHSLSLLSDAGHNFTDAVALAISWYAVRVARKPASAARTFGHHRAGILAALANAVVLLVLAIFILAEAYHLLVHPPVRVGSGIMIVVAAVALAMNTLIAGRLHGHAAHDLNVRGAFLHMVGDALSSAGVLVAGLTIYLTGWTYADPLVSALIALFIAYSSYGIIRDAVNILLEGTPRGLDVDALRRDMLAVPGVADVHDLHLWSIADGLNALCCHLSVAEAYAQQPAHVVFEVKRMIASDYRVGHSTIETECEGCGENELYCNMRDDSHRNSGHIELSGCTERHGASTPLRKSHSQSG